MILHSIGRHSKSLDTQRFACALCSGQLVLLTPSTPRAPTPFANFVKENYKTVRQNLVGQSHAEVMRKLSADFASQTKLSQSWDHCCDRNGLKHRILGNLFSPLNTSVKSPYIIGQLWLLIMKHVITVCKISSTVTGRSEPKSCSCSCSWCRVSGFLFMLVFFIWMINVWLRYIFMWLLCLIFSLWILLKFKCVIVHHKFTDLCLSVWQLTETSSK